MKSKDDFIYRLKLSAYHYLHYRARTVYEMRAQLTKKAQKYPEALPYINEVISFLLEEKYLNDKEFIIEYVRSRVASKPRSKFLMTRELKMKGVTQEDVDEYFQTNTLNEQELATRALIKVIGRWESLHPLKRKKKAYDYLARKGFSYDIIHLALLWQTKYNRVIKN